MQNPSNTTKFFWAKSFFLLLRCHNIGIIINLPPDMDMQQIYFECLCVQCTKKYQIFYFFTILHFCCASLIFQKHQESLIKTKFNSLLVVRDLFFPLLLTLSPSISLGKIQRTGLTVTLQGICEFIHLSYVVIARRALVVLKTKASYQIKQSNSWLGVRLEKA